MIDVSRLIEKRRLAIASIEADERIAAQLSGLLNHHKTTANMMEAALSTRVPQEERGKLIATLADMRRAIGRLQNDLDELMRANAQGRADLDTVTARLTAIMERATACIDTSMPSEVVAGLHHARAAWLAEVMN